MRKNDIINSGVINLICLTEIVSKFHFFTARYCNATSWKIEKKHTVNILFVNVKFQIFYFLCCKGVVSGERRNEGLSIVARELLEPLLTLYFYNVLK